jgi:hypothetical protein
MQTAFTYYWQIMRNGTTDCALFRVPQESKRVPQKKKYKISIIFVEDLNFGVYLVFVHPCQAGLCVCVCLCRGVGGGADKGASGLCD